MLPHGSLTSAGSPGQACGRPSRSRERALPGPQRCRGDQRPLQGRVRRGQGRSGGFRVIVVFRPGERAFFVHGFAKSDRENLRRNELRALRSLAEGMLGLDGAGLETMLANGTISEVNCDGQAV